MARDRGASQPLLDEGNDEYEVIGGTDYETDRRKSRKVGAQKCLHTIAFVFLGSLFVAAIILLAVLLIRVGGQAPRVKVTCGEVQGTYDVFKTVFSFKAIPYAAPPVGQRRWKPPEALSSATCWNDVYMADEFRSICSQRDPMNHSYVGEEDCLFLDINTPSLDSNANMPVLVYFHGGYLRFGDTRTPGYFADKNLASKHHAVFVNVQYRVGTMGFLVLDQLKDSTGNYGFLDQIQALKWVQENIGKFGGNKDCVTIYGQSSGGSSVLNLMISPLAKGLFHRGWSASGSVFFNATLAEARKKNEFFVKRVGCDTAADVKECLYNVPAENATMLTYDEWGYGDALDIPRKDHLEHPLPVVDDIVFMAGLLDSFQQNLSVINRVPLMIGSTAQETDVFPDIRKGYSMDISKWSQETYKEYVTKHLDTFGENVTKIALKMYPYKKDPELPLMDLMSDARVTCATNLITEAAANSLPGLVYRYVVTYWPSKPINALRMPFDARYAFHLLDIFGFFDAMGMYMKDGSPTKADQNFAVQMQESMMLFAKTGEVFSAWESYEKHSVALIGEAIEVEGAYRKEYCKFWLNNGFFEYTWMN